MTDRLEWCEQCYAWKPFPHDQVRAPWRVRWRRRLARPFWRLVGWSQRLASWVAGEDSPPPPPPKGYRTKHGRWSTIAHKAEGS